jgi:hypothetical protein
VQTTANIDNIGKLRDWVASYCRDHHRSDTVPADRNHASLHPARLRRTLAWFIARKPRDLAAAAIQYGHLKVQMTLGYSGSYASGFPDDLAFEECLARLETLADAHDRLQHAERVSGPAPETYRHRVNAANRFAGHTLRTKREAATVLSNPDLQIFQGKGHDLRPGPQPRRLPPHPRRTRPPPHPRHRQLPSGLRQHRPHRPRHHRSPGPSGTPATPGRQPAGPTNPPRPGAARTRRLDAITSGHEKVRASP